VILLYPQLPHPVALRLAEVRRSLPPSDLAALVVAEHDAAVFTPTGGSPATPEHLMALRASLVDLAQNAGYPDGGSRESRAAFDAAAGPVLYTTMRTAPAEAAKAGIWEFLSVVLMCDLVRWRFPGLDSGTDLARYLSGRRNTLERLWWRAHLVRDDDESASPYGLLATVGEDEIVQIMERPNLAGAARLTRTICRELLDAAGRYPAVPRRTLIREAQKRLMRLSAFLSFEVLGEQETRDIVRNAFDRAVQDMGDPTAPVRNEVADG
jgi:hypothetical protein